MKFKKNKELISVIVPCYNSGVLLKRCLNSLIKQTWLNVEIILVNDGTTDKKTLKIIDNYRNISYFKIIDQSNRGLPSARNKGGWNAKGNYLFFLDSDDWIEPDTLEKMIFAIKNDPQVAFIFSDIVLEGDVNKIVKKEYNFFEQLFLNQIPYSIFISKKIWTKYGGYNEDMKSGYEDWEFNIRLGANSQFGKRLAEPLFHYNVSNEGMLLSHTSKKHGKLWRYIILKNKKLFKLKTLLLIWKEWRFKPSNYPLLILFVWYLFIRSVPEHWSTRIFILLRNSKWLFTRKRNYFDKKINSIPILK